MARLKENSDLTMIGSLIGTPRYMAPEVRFGLEADSRADVFSATRLFLELLKMLPENTKCPRSHLPQIPCMSPGNLIDYSVVYPTAFIPVLVKGLDPDRDKRYQTVSELMTAIKKALPHLQEQAAPAFTEEAAPPDEQAAEEPPASAEEVNSITKLLADFTGPVATLLMEKYETAGMSADSLALEISRKIPGHERQQEFLRRWKVICLSRQEPAAKKESKVFPDKERSHPLLEEMLSKISSEFAHYVEPISKTLLRQGSKKTTKAD